MGWYVPLLLQAKIFLQDLWREQHDWDTELPAQKKEKWLEIVSNINGFHKELPRYSGSCTGNKCGAINASSLIEELREGNQYPLWPYPRNSRDLPG